MINDIDSDAITIKAISTLSDKTALNIVELLKTHDLSFSQIQKIINIDKGTLSYHIKKLLKSALIVNYYQKKEGTNEYSFYQLTGFAKDLLDNISKINPDKEKTKIETNSIEMKERKHNEFITKWIKSYYDPKVSKRELIDFFCENILRRGYRDIEIRLTGESYLNNELWKKTRSKMQKKEKLFEELL